MRFRSSRIVTAFVCLIMFSPGARALEVVVAETFGGSFDLTAFDNFVRFTANSTGAGFSDASLSGGIPTVAVTSGTALSNFSENYTNGAFGSGEINTSDNPNAVNLRFSSGGPPNSNDRYWFGSWNTNQGVSFSLTVPTASGSMALFTGGFNSTAANGGASFSASFALHSQSSSATFPDTDGAAADPYWEARFTVTWSGRTVGDVMSLQFANVPSGGDGYSGLIGVVVAEPSTHVLGGFASVLAAVLTKCSRLALPAV